MLELRQRLLKPDVELRKSWLDHIAGIEVPAEMAAATQSVDDPLRVTFSWRFTKDDLRMDFTMHRNEGADRFISSDDGTSYVFFENTGSEVITGNICLYSEDMEHSCPLATIDDYWCLPSQEFARFLSFFATSGPLLEYKQEIVAAEITYQMPAS